MNAKRNRGSFTLVEVLLALTLTAAVMTLVARIAVQAQRLSSTVDQQIRDRHRRAYWLAQIDRDMKGAIDAEDSISAELDAHGRPSIRILTLASDMDSADSAVLEPTEVTYRILRQENTYRMVRESRSMLRGQSVISEETVACGVTSIDVELWIDAAWYELSEFNEKRQPEPEAIRVSVTRPNTEPIDRETWLLGNAHDRNQRHGR